MYKFLDLNHTLPDDNVDREELFRITDDRINYDNYSYYDGIPEITSVLENWLEDNAQYYLMHERLLHKGKLRKHLGHIVISTKDKIIPWVVQSLESNDLRPIRIMHLDKTGDLLSFNEDAILHVFPH